MTARSDAEEEGPAKEARIRIVIADDDAFARRALRDLLEQAGLIVIGDVANGRDAVELAVFYRPEIVLLDVMMPVMDGIDAAKQISERSPESRIVMLTRSDEEDLAMLALRAGAVGYLTKDTNFEDLPGLLARALEQGAVVSPGVTLKLIEQLRTIPANGRGMRPIKSLLSPREWEVLDLLCEGKTTEQIADDLFLVPDTVYSHVKSILRKLNVKSRKEAIAAAAKLRSPEGAAGDSPG